MSAFALALHSFKSGRLSHDELLSAIYRELAVEKKSPAALLEILKVQQVTEPLPDDTHDVISERIASWPQDPTTLVSNTQLQMIGRSPGPGVGDILQGRFSLVALIGVGGMSHVFKAIDLRRAEARAINPFVAVKVLTEPFNEYFGSITALQREAHKLQSLSHPNIVRVIDCDRDGRRVFMTMEHIAGESLQKRLRSRGAARFDAGAAQALVSLIGNALEYAHANRIVHGDLKPGNIIVTADGAPKIIDFGMARFIARSDGFDQGDFGRNPGPKAITARYASPEMAAGQDPEPCDDVYALACIAYEVLSGQHPFGRRSDAPPRDARILPIRPPGMRLYQYEALMKALAFERASRTSSVRSFLDDFLAIQRVHPRNKRVMWVGAAATILVVTLALLLKIGHVGNAIRADNAQGSVVRDCPTCPLLTIVPAGSYTQGASSDAIDSSSYEQPSHVVTIAHAFAMSTNEVTVSEFREFVDATRRAMSGCNVYDGRWVHRDEASWRAPGFVQSGSHPVACVSWEDAGAYAKWLSQKTGHTYRLPSASEWEYAARAGSGLALPWSANADTACIHANVADDAAGQRFPGWITFSCNDGYVNTAPVGSFKSNAFGLNDMLGNVFEWVQDCWHDDYSGAPVDGTARQTDDCEEHELRGGSWFSEPRHVSASYRNRFAGEYRSSTVGMRLVRTLDP